MYSPTAIALLAGAVAVVLTMYTIQQAYKSIDTRIYIFVAGAIPLGQAIVEPDCPMILQAGWTCWCIDGPASDFARFIRYRRAHHPTDVGRRNHGPAWAGRRFPGLGPAPAAPQPYVDHGRDTRSHHVLSNPNRTSWKSADLRTRPLSILMTLSKWGLRSRFWLPSLSYSSLYGSGPINARVLKPG